MITTGDVAVGGIGGWLVALALGRRDAADVVDIADAGALIATRADGRRFGLTGAAAEHKRGPE